MSGNATAPSWGRRLTGSRISFGLALLGALVALILPAACAPNAAPGANAAAAGPRLTFPERSHQFGQISYSQPTDYRFAFTNTGNRPLEVSDIQPEPTRPGA